MSEPGRRRARAEGTEDVGRHGICQQCKARRGFGHGDAETQRRQLVQLHETREVRVAPVLLWLAVERVPCLRCSAQRDVDFEMGDAAVAQHSELLRRRVAERALLIQTVVAGVRGADTKQPQR